MLPEGCAADFDKSAFGLARAPRTGEYRGFVFASLAASGPSFEDHIGPMKRNIDDLLTEAALSHLEDPRLTVLAGELDLMRGRYSDSLIAFKEAEKSLQLSRSEGSSCFPFPLAALGAAF